MILDGAAFRALVSVGDAGAVGGGADLRVCRLVFDPDEDLFGPISDLSSFGHSVAATTRHQRGMTDAQHSHQRARELVASGDVEVVEMTDAEFRLARVVSFEAKAFKPLGIASAAAATIAIARSRSWT